ncbi:protein kinase [Tumidithrix elongata RA019]|uniref:Protein kinase n=1 Tax=Tumidithrix elongata BACA0141 TaxID=2716417 RepID=A0AAW9Q4J5_9CYAN|nr:protein kinase [Tumidithrix elongata RA019]
MISLNLWRSQNQPEIIHTWTFHHNPVIKIGRALDNHVVISHPAVSRYHLELRRNAKGWNLTNLSVNNTFMRGQPVHYITLPSESLIQLSTVGPNILVKVLPDCTHMGNISESMFCRYCGAPLKAIKTIQDYQVIRLLGQGGMGTTYQVWQGGQVQVLKEMNADMADNPKAKELFEREARTLRILKHPGIPRFEKFFIHDRHPYLVMEMIYGQDLESWVREKGVVPIQQAIAWMIQLCEILNYLHTQDPPVIHRDIKPANLLIRHTDRALILIDFGAVKEIGMPSTTRIGAPSYCPIEQSKGHPVIQSDLYAIAPTLIYLLTGKDPATYLEDRGMGMCLYSDRIAQIPSVLTKIVVKLSAPAPSDRYQTATEVAEALKSVIA